MITIYNGKTEYYTLDGKRMSSPNAVNGVCIKRDAQGSKKIAK